MAELKPIIKEVIGFEDINLELPEEGDDEFKPIPQSKFIPEYEETVARYMAITPTLPKNTILYEYAKQPEGLDSYGFLRWAKEEIRRCKEGHNGMSGKMYMYFNYCYIQAIGKKIRPKFRVIDNEWFKFVEACQKSKEWGIICVKRRRVGASWKESADMLHDCIFNKHFKIGMNSKTERDSFELFRKVKFMYENLPVFLQVKISSNTKSSLDFSYYIKNAQGTKIKKGNESTILAVAPTDNAFEGQMLSKWICDEAGKIKNLATMWSYTEDCLMQETRRTGLPIIFGTAGDIGAEGKDLEYMWANAQAYKLKKFFFSGYHGLNCDEYGNDDKEGCIRWIIYERHRREQLRPEEYNNFLQKYPLSVSEAFTVTAAAGVGDLIKIRAHMQSLRETPAKAVRGFFRLVANEEVEWVPAAQGKVIIYEQPERNIESLYIAGCLPAGEKVLTDKGLKNIETITFDDKLVSKDGDYVDIKECQTYQVDGSLYNITVANTFRSTKFTSEHPLYVSDNVKGYTSFKKKKRENLKYSHQKFNWDFKPVKDIKNGDWIKYPNVYKKFKEIDHSLWPSNTREHLSIKSPLDNADFWWFVGLWLGDGHTMGDAFYISCNIKETKLIDRLCSIIISIFGRSPQIYKKSGNCVDIRFNSKQLSKFFKINFGKYSYGKIIPEWVKFLKIDYKLALIGGYIDSDGCITQDKRRNLYNCEIVSVNLELMESLQDILFSVGVISTTSKLRNAKEAFIKERLIQQRETYRVRLSHYWIKKLKELGCLSVKVSLMPIQLIETRSQNMGCFFDETFDYIYFQIKNIQKEAFKGIVYNFHCETSTYICKHITSHNCDPADHDDVSNDASDLSMFVLKRPRGVEPAKVVCEYTDRPREVIEYYEQALLCSLYYNSCKILIERNRYLMIQHFKATGKTYLLARTPIGVARITGGRTDTVGVQMTPQAKDYLRGCIGKYVKDYVQWIPSYELLQEFLYFGAKNTDKAMAFGIALMFLDDYKVPTYTSTEKLSMNPHFGYRRVKGEIQKVKYERKPGILEGYVPPSMDLTAPVPVKPIAPRPRNSLAR